MIRKILIGLLGLGVLMAIVLWAWWPKNLVVKGPVLDFLTGSQVAAPEAGMLAARFKLPPGFRIGLYATDVPHARVMKFTDTGDMLVSSMRDGKVILLHADRDGDGAADGRTDLMAGLTIPHGLALRDGFLYVAETNRIIRAPFDAAARTVGDAETIFDGLPPGGNHRTRTIAFGPDGALYVTVGSSCNVCLEDNPYRASMIRMQADGTGAAIHATGLRNTVGFDWQPGTGALYGTDNGRDLLGDDTPNCELNLIEKGGDYGWPYAYDDRVPDPDFGEGNQALVAASTGPAHGFGAHRAPLGLRFLNPGQEPPGFEGVALVAEHGSWNRSSLVGYKLVSLHFGADGSIEERDFLTGFEQDQQVIGRPADVVQGPDGAIYVADDYAGAIYRIGWAGLTVADTGFEKAVVTDPFMGLNSLEIQELAAQGEVLFEANGCAACHVPNGVPLTVPQTVPQTVSQTGPLTTPVALKEFRGLQARYDIESLQQLLAAPPGPMPLYELSDAERRALAVYVMNRFP